MVDVDDGVAAMGYFRAHPFYCVVLCCDDVWGVVLAVFRCVVLEVSNEGALHFLSDAEVVCLGVDWLVSLYFLLHFVPSALS